MKKKLLLIMIFILIVGCAKKNKDGFYIEGYQRGIHYETKTKYNPIGYDRDGYDRDGYDRDGYDRDGYGRGGYDKNGYNIKGYDRDGYDKDGYNIKGYDRDGYDRGGYNKNGYNIFGFVDKTKKKFLKNLKSPNNDLETYERFLQSNSITKGEFEKTKDYKRRIYSKEMAIKKMRDDILDEKYGGKVNFNVPLASYNVDTEILTLEIKNVEFIIDERNNYATSEEESDTTYYRTVELKLDETIKINLALEKAKISFQKDYYGKSLPLSFIINYKIKENLNYNDLRYKDSVHNLYKGIPLELIILYNDKVVFEKYI